MNNKEENDIKKDTNKYECINKDMKYDRHGIGLDFLNSVIQDSGEKKVLGLIIEHKDPKDILEILLAEGEQL